MWSRPSVLGQDRSETKKSVLVLVLHAVVSCLGLTGLVLRCETRSCTRLSSMTLKDAATFQVLFLYSVHGTSLLWRSTVALTYLTFHSNHRPISHRFRDKRGENRQFSYPVYIAPAEGVTLGIGYRRRVRKKTTRMIWGYQMVEKVLRYV